MKKNLLSKAILAFAGCAMLFTSVIPTQAAGNQALAAPYSFSNVGMANKKAFKKTNSIYFGVDTGLKKAKYNASDLNISAVVYVPKKAISKNGSSVGVDITGVADPNTYGKDSEAVVLINKLTCGIETKGGKMSTSGVNALTGESTSLDSYMKVKPGKGKYSGYYILKINNMPYSYIGNDAASGEYYLRDVVINVYGQKCKSSGVLYVDNVKIRAGDNTLCNYTFNDKKGTPSYCWVTLDGKQVTGASVAKM